MNKQKLLSLIDKQSGISSKDLESLESLVEEHPYFQGGHNLIAKTHQIHKTLGATDKLHKAAIYTPNRGYLKQIIEEDPAELVSAPEPETNKATAPEPVAEEKPAEAEAPTPTVEPEEAREEKDEEVTVPEEASDLIVNTEEDEEHKISLDSDDNDNPIYRELQETMDALKSRKNVFGDEKAESGDKVEEKAKTSAKPAAAKKTTPKKKTTTTKATKPKKTTSKTAAAKKTPAKKATAAKKTPAKKTTAAKKTTTAKKSTATAKKTTTARKTTKKKS